jgi:hypothetical protein
MSTDIHLSPFKTTVESVDSYLLPALLTTIFCCMPLGIVALIYSGKVSAAKEEDDLEAAMEASRKARRWYRAAIIVSVIANIIIQTLNVLSLFLNRAPLLS